MASDDKRSGRSIELNKCIAGKMPGKLTELHCLIGGDKARELHRTGHYGVLIPGGSVMLNPFETILLIERQHLIVMVPTEMQLEDVVAHFEPQLTDFWTRYLIYKDLRERGLQVRLLVGRFGGFKLQSRKNKQADPHAMSVVFPISEGVSLPLSILEEHAAIAESYQVALVYGVVDTVGDVSYYSVKEAEMNNL